MQPEPKYGKDAAVLTASALRGRATGSLFFIGFGAIWMYVGLKQTHLASHTALTLLLFCAAALLALVWLLMRRAHDLPDGYVSPEVEARTQRMFNAVNIIQWVSVATAIAILNLLRMPNYIVPAIAIIVGLHLYPLAGAFRYRQHYVTGALLVGWPLACLLAVPAPRISGVCALGVAGILLFSATSTLLRCFAALRGAVPSTLEAQAHTS